MAALGHAIMTAHFPELAHEHAWDGQSYSVQDSQGTRGTVTFSPNCCVAAFRNDANPRAGAVDAQASLRGASPEVVHLAESETLQYLLDTVDGHTRPSITAAFWIENDQLCAAEPLDEVMRNGAFILHRQMLDEAAAIDAWAEYWEMSDAQRDLLVSLYHRKVSAPDRLIVLSDKEIAAIGAPSQEGLAESRTSFLEIGVAWPT